MKFLAVLATFVAAAVAVPTESHKPPPGHCIPGTYSCAVNEETGCDGWQVCDIDATWKYGGDCPPKTHCYFNTENQSPYCVL